MARVLSCSPKSTFRVFPNLPVCSRRCPCNRRPRARQSRHRCDRVRRGPRARQSPHRCHPVRRGQLRILRLRRRRRHRMLHPASPMARPRRATAPSPPTVHPPRTVASRRRRPDLKQSFPEAAMTNFVAPVAGHLDEAVHILAQNAGM